jgi:hypothetical protein
VVDPSSIATTAAKAVGAVARVQPWKTAKRHDRLILEQYEDLITWARDDVKKEARDLQGVGDRLAPRGMLSSGQFGFELTEVREEYARRWRDRKREVERAIKTIQEQEGASVRIWRALCRPFPVNPWQEEQSALAAAWEDEELRREAVEREVQSGKPDPGCRVY